MEAIDGKKIAEEILNSLKKKTAPKKFLAVFSVSPNEATKKFLSEKKKVADFLGVDFRQYDFPQGITQDELRKEVLKVALGNACGGVIVQLPLPSHIDAQYVLNAIPKEKDVDVLGERALGAFYAGRNSILPPAVSVVEEILKTFNIELSTLNCSVVGLGRLVGKPISQWVQGKCKELSLLDKGSDFESLKYADIVICGAGDPGIINPNMLKDGSVVIDFGYGKKDGKIGGDFDPQLSTFNSKFLNYSPTPGGTGPILVAKLFENFYELAGVEAPSKKGKFYPQIN